MFFACYIYGVFAKRRKCGRGVRKTAERGSAGICGAEYMDMALTTDVTLLERITAGDEISWNQFHEIYSPLIRLFGADWGLDGADCDELVQDVMVNFFKASRVFRYDRVRGSFRAYLRAIVRSCVLNLLRRRGSGGEAGENTEAVDCAFEEKWDAEWYNHLLGEALKVLRSELDQLAYQCFYRYAIAGDPPELVARELGISVNAVYVNKCRALARLRSIVRQLNTL